MILGILLRVSDKITHRIELDVHFLLRHSIAAAFALLSGIATCKHHHAAGCNS